MQSNMESNMEFISTSSNYPITESYSHLTLCIKGLNQFYYINNLNLEYESLSSSEKINTTTYIYKKFLEIILKNPLKIIFYNEDEQFLQIDKKIIENFSELEFEKEFLTEEELTNKIRKKEGKEYIIFNEKIKTLLKFHKMGCWTVLLTHFVFSHLDKEANTEAYKTISENVNYLTSGGEKFYQFTSNNFYQLNYYYNEIKEINKISNINTRSNKELFNLRMKELNPIRVCLFVRVLRRSQEFSKQKFYISNEKVLYQSHMGGDDISLNFPFDCLLAKTVEVQDLNLYSDTLDNIVKYCQSNKIWMVNYIPTLKQFVEKDLQGDYLTEFTKSSAIYFLYEKYFHQPFKLKYPLSVNISLEQVLKNTKIIFFSFLEDNKITFPLIVKYKGKANYFKHLITFIFNRDGLDNYINYLNDIQVAENEDKLKTILVLQTFVNHGGNVLKFYHINKENYLDYRSSLPDLNEEFQSNFPEGFWSFKTIDLETGKSKDLLSKFNSSSKVKILMNQDQGISLDFAYEVVDLFEKFSKFTLYGIDLLYAYEEKTFYLIDCNSLPGYKIKSDIKIDEKFRQHFINYVRGNK